MDNAVGSLTQLQKSVIVGSMLGDGYLRIVPGRKDAFLEINHSYKAKEYADWKYLLLEDITKSGPKVRKGNGKRVAYRFYTKQHPEITDFFRIFYINGKKHIPDKLILDNISLAIWYMDDGSKCGKDNLYLNTQQFDITDQQKLILALSTFGLKVTLQKDKIYYRLRFLKESVYQLQNLIEKYIIPSMRYKLSYDPVET